MESEGEEDMDQTVYDSAITVLPRAISQDEAVSAKKKKLECRLFGIPTVRFEIESEEKVFVPYRYLVFDFRIDRNSNIGGKSGRLDRNGSVHAILDMNEVHCFEYDYAESGDLREKMKKIIPKRATVMPEKCTDDEAIETAEKYVQNKVLRRLYASAGNLSKACDVSFYRPAYKLAIRYKGKEVNERFAYTDTFGVENEHILGLKFRMDP
jgi:hypothetical protein